MTLQGEKNKKESRNKIKKFLTELIGGSKTSNYYIIHTH